MVTYLAVEERRFIEAAARLRGMSASTFLRYAGLTAALAVADEIPDPAARFTRHAIAPERAEVATP